MIAIDGAIWFVGPDILTVIYGQTAGNAHPYEADSAITALLENERFDLPEFLRRPDG